MSERGHNLRRGQPNGRKGRKAGGKARAAIYNALPAPGDCEHCAQMGYTTMAQHNGHKGFRVVMDNRPEALSNLKEKIKRTGRADSRARWRAISQ